MNKKDLIKAWRAYRKSPDAKKVSVKTDIVNGPDWTIALVKEALVFWQFLRDQIKNHRGKDFDWNEWRSFLCDFTQEKKNPYVMFVAAIEYLPTTLWRKILWKHNIDFVSFESCLRRLTQKQVDEIIDNFYDFRKGNLPRVFTWWDMKVKKITHESLSFEKLRTDKRYLSKGSMSYNLLGLDFGFNAFPKGVNDDTKVIEVSPFRFLSEKQHADDFVVNTEDGKYYKSYKSARSNYVYRPNRYVELKTHICPGFWYTLLIHTLFWIISPLCAIFSFEELMASGWSWSPLFLAPFVIGCFTILWVIVALIKRLGRLISGLLGKIDMESVFAVTIAILIVSFVSAILAGITISLSIGTIIRTFLNVGIIILFIDYLSEKSEHGSLNIYPFSGVKRLLKILLSLSFLSLIIEHPLPLLNGVLAVIMFIWEILIAIWGALVSAWQWIIVAIPALWDWLVWLVVSIPSALQWLVTAVVNIGEWIAIVLLPWLLSVVMVAYKALVLFFEVLGLVSLMFVAAILLPVLLVWLVDVFTDFQRYPKIAKFVSSMGLKIINVMFFLSILGLIFVPIAMLGGGGDEIGSFTADFFFPIIVCLLLIVGMFFFSRRSVYKHDKILSWFEKALLYKVGERSSARNFSRQIIDNNWLLSLSSKNRKGIVNEMYRLVYTDISYVFRYCNARDIYSLDHIFSRFLLRIKKVETVLSMRRLLSRDTLVSGERFIEIIKERYFEQFLDVLEHETVDDAMKLIIKRIKKDKKKQSWERSKFVDKWSKRIDAVLDPTLAVVKQIFTPIFWLVGKVSYLIWTVGVRLGKMAIWLGREVWYFVKTIYKLYELFNKRCPYVAKNKNIMHQ